MCQIELHPYVYKASIPALQYMKERGIPVMSYGGLTPIARFPGGPIDSVLAKIAERVGATSGKEVTVAQVLQLWLRKKGLSYVTYGRFLFCRVNPLKLYLVSTTASTDRMQEYLDSANLPSLSDEEEREIDEAGSKVHHRVLVSTAYA